MIPAFKSPQKIKENHNISLFFNTCFIFVFSDTSEVFCPMVFDSFLCWPRTKAGGKVWQKCPEGVRGLDSQSKLTQWAKFLFLMT